MFETETRTEDPALELKPYGFTNVPWYTTEVEALSDYRLRVRFVDGVEGIVEMRELIFSPEGGVFRSLTDIEEFAKVSLEHGAVVWANGVDIAPDATHDDIERDGIRILR